MYGSEELALLDAIIAKRQNQLLTLIGSDGANGPALGATILTQSLLPSGRRPPRSRAFDDGFRPGKAPNHLVVSRSKSNSTLSRSSVEKVDPAWVHGRDQNPDQQRLRGSFATVLGCGSIGAAVAVLLAQSGVGKIRLVDRDFLKAANIGRHPLGMRYVGQNKAKALAHHIKERFPHIAVEAMPTWWEDVPDRETLLSETQIIVSTMGDWSAEAALNDLHLESGRRLPIVYGWTESQAGAGHAVVVNQVGGCFQCGMDHHGSPLLQATSWENGSTLLQEPACGAVFQPYGAVEISFTVALIAETALETLLGRNVGSPTDRASISECFASSRHNLRAFVLLIVGTAQFPDGLHLSLHDEVGQIVLEPSSRGVTNNGPTHQRKLVRWI